MVAIFDPCSLVTEEEIGFLTCCCPGCHEKMYPPWLRTVQRSVSRVVSKYYQMPAERRSCLRILELIGEEWPKSIRLFESKKHYYKSLLTVTDYLLQFLQVDRNHSLPILLEHADTWIEEVHVQMRLHLLVVTRTSSSFILKKYLAFDHPIYTESLQHMIRLFCHHHLNGLSGRIEIVNPLEGKITKFDLDPSDIQSSLDYMRLMKEMKQDEWHAGLRFLN